LPTSADEGDAVGTVAFFAGEDGTRLAARLAGPEEAPPLVLVHGFSQGSLAFAHQFRGPLSERYRLIAPDLRGHGMSEAGELAAMAEGATWGADLAAALDAFAPGRAAVLLGWSFGGRVLCEFLRREEEGRVAALVFVGAVTQSVLADGSRPATEEAAAALRGMAEEDDALAFAAVSRFLDLSTVRPLPAAERERLVQVNAAVRPAVRRAMQALVSDNDGLLARLSRPLVVIHGEEDRVIRRASAENIAARVPGARLSVMPGVGHAPFLEAPARFDALIADMLGESGPAPTGG
jgi:pimeloyl-ACP methyl ester carboxylesterase